MGFNLFLPISILVISITTELVVADATGIQKCILSCMVDHYCPLRRCLSEKKCLMGCGRHFINNPTEFKRFEKLFPNEARKVLEENEQINDFGRKNDKQEISKDQQHTIEYKKKLTENGFDDLKFTSFSMPSFPSFPSLPMESMFSNDTSTQKFGKQYNYQSSVDVFIPKANKTGITNECTKTFDYDFDDPAKYGEICAFQHCLIGGNHGKSLISCPANNYAMNTVIINTVTNGAKGFMKTYSHADTRTVGDNFKQSLGQQLRIDEQGKKMSKHNNTSGGSIDNRYNNTVNQQSDIYV